MKRYIYIVLLLLLSSCSYQTRFANLIKRHPDLLNVTDTVIVRDTFIVHTQTHDTVISNHFDTSVFYTTDSSVRVRLVNIHDSIKVNIYKKGDTVIVVKKVPFKQALPVQVTKWYENNWFYIALSLLIIIIAFTIIKLAK